MLSLYTDFRLFRWKPLDNLKLESHDTSTVPENQTISAKQKSAYWRAGLVHATCRETWT